jgi:hypothetical protein
MREETEVERLLRYIKILEDLLSSEDDGYTFGAYGWRAHVPAEFKVARDD